MSFVRPSFSARLLQPTMACFIFDWYLNIMKSFVLRLEEFGIVYIMCLSVQYVTGFRWRQPSSLPLNVLDSDWSTKSEWRGLWILTIWYGLRVKMSMYQSIRYSVEFLINGMSNGYTLITKHEWKIWIFYALYTFDTKENVDTSLLYLLRHK